VAASFGTSAFLGKQSMFSAYPGLAFPQKYNPGCELGDYQQ
jgi:hypothetical protein